MYHPIAHMYDMIYPQPNKYNKPVSIFYKTCCIKRTAIFSIVYIQYPMSTQRDADVYNTARPHWANRVLFCYVFCCGYIIINWSMRVFYICHKSSHTSGCRRCSNNILILDLIPRFYGLGKANCKNARSILVLEFGAPFFFFRNFTVFINFVFVSIETFVKLLQWQ